MWQPTWWRRTRPPHRPARCWRLSLLNACAWRRNSRIFRWVWDLWIWVDGCGFWWLGGDGFWWIGGYSSGWLQWQGSCLDWWGFQWWTGLVSVRRMGTHVLEHNVHTGWFSEILQSLLDADMYLEESLLWMVDVDRWLSWNGLHENTGMNHRGLGHT